LWSQSNNNNMNYFKYAYKAKVENFLFSALFGHVIASSFDQAQEIASERTKDFLEKYNRSFDKQAHFGGMVSLLDSYLFASADVNEKGHVVGQTIDGLIHFEAEPDGYTTIIDLSSKKTESIVREADGSFARLNGNGRINITEIDITHDYYLIFQLVDQILEGANEVEEEFCACGNDLSLDVEKDHKVCRECM